MHYVRLGVPFYQKTSSCVAPLREGRWSSRHRRRGKRTVRWGDRGRSRVMDDVVQWFFRHWMDLDGILDGLQAHVTIQDAAMHMWYRTSNQTRPKLTQGVMTNCARHRLNFLKALSTFVGFKFWDGEIIEDDPTIWVHHIFILFFSNIWLYFVLVLTQSLQICDITMHFFQGG